MKFSTLLAFSDWQDYPQAATLPAQLRVLAQAISSGINAPRLILLKAV